MRFELFIASRYLRAKRRQAFVAPRTPLESSLAKRWAEILRVEQIGIHDDFFASGGDSLLASRVLSHVYDMTQIELEVSRFFEAPTIAEVAQHLERTGTLGTLSRRHPGHPFVSIMPYATDTEGRPLLLISALASMLAVVSIPLEIMGS